MKMTEKMKQELKESMEKEGIALSDEQMEEVTGGRALIGDESQQAWEGYGWKNYHRTVGYLQYIESLPEGSPEVSLVEFMHRVGPDFAVTYTCRRCGATLTAPLWEVPICSGCGEKVYDGDMMEMILNSLCSGRINQ